MGNSLRLRLRRYTAALTRVSAQFNLYFHNYLIASIRRRGTDEDFFFFRSFLFFLLCFNSSLAFYLPTKVSPSVRARLRSRELCDVEVYEFASDLVSSCLWPCMMALFMHVVACPRTRVRMLFLASWQCHQSCFSCHFVILMEPIS